ncbi:AAA family ATPase [Mesorhizobium sp. A623]
MAAMSEAEVSTFDRRLARYFLHRLRHAAQDAALEQAIKVGILDLEVTIIDGRRVKTFQLGPAVYDKSEAEVRRILHRIHRRSVRQLWEFGSDEDAINLPIDVAEPLDSEITPGSATVSSSGHSDGDNRVGSGIGELSDAAGSALSVEKLVRMVRHSAESLRAQDVATLLLVAQGLDRNPIRLKEALRILGFPQPVVAVSCEVVGFEDSFVSLLERGIILPGKVAVTNGFKIRRGRGMGFAQTGEPQWEVVCFAGWQCIDDDGEIGQAALTGLPILGVAEKPHTMPSQLLAAAELNLDCGDLNAEIVNATIEAVLDSPPDESLEPEDCTLLGLADLATAIRPGVLPSRAIAVLREIVEERRSAAGDEETDDYTVHKLSDEKKPAQNSTVKNDRGKNVGSASEIILPVELTGDDDKDRFTLRIETLFGYGEEAPEWALALKDDLEFWRAGTLRWEDMVTKLLLFGPPGTGKTQFAKALCNTLEVPLIATSVTTWLECGHLGDVLKRMSKVFAEAQEHSPSILFIDEIDGIGRRGRSRDYDDYWTSVVNKALELLDGTVKSTGVVIVGAANNPGVIDKALLRSGRLETHIEIPRPDTAALIGILRHHLQNDLDAIVVSAPVTVRGGMQEAAPNVRERSDNKRKRRRNAKRTSWKGHEFIGNGSSS